MTSGSEKVTVNVPKDVLEKADYIAKIRNMSRSKLVAMCLIDLYKDILKAQMVEGYKAMAQENQEFADSAMDIAHEVLPEWEQV